MWTKLGDEFVDDAADLSDAAVRTHVEATGWSNRRLLDLVIPKRDLRRFAFSAVADNAVAELVAAGWWEDLGDSWYLAYRPEWQQSREQVETRRETNLRAQWHRRGDHRKCDPLKCSALSAADTSDDARADTTVDNAADPGRVGSVSGQALYEQPPTKVEPITNDDLETCSHCGHREQLDDAGLCQVIECVADRVALARAAS